MKRGHGVWWGGAAVAGWLTLTVQAAPVTEKIDVIDLIRQKQTEVHLAAKSEFTDKPSEIFQVRDDGMLHISGRGYGYLATQQAYQDYHLVVEFKWTGVACGKRADRARDNGILVHAHGPHGSCGGTWIASVEAQIIEGGMGDIIVVSGKLPDGTPVTTSIEAEIELDRDGEKRWKKGAPRQTVTGGRVNWEKRDEDWKDLLGFRGLHDLDAPVGDWNRFEVIARGDTLRYFFNGRLVNEAFAVKPSAGRVCIQTEAAEMVVRRFELWPLDTFKEAWKPVVQVTDPIDGAVLHPRLGRVTAAGVEVDVRGKADPDSDVRINGVAAVREGDAFSGTVLLRTGENVVDVQARKPGTEPTAMRLRLNMAKESVKRYRVVIDDNSFFLRDITQKGYASLFDCFYLNMLKDLHDRYGTQFTLNIFFTTGDDWDLTRFPERYRDEWRANASWLRLAFHAHAEKPDRPYTAAPIAKLIEDLERVNAQVLRFAGPETLSPPTVIHWGMTRPDAWKALYDKGSHVLGGYFSRWATGWEVNYNMDAFRSEWLSRHDLLKDHVSGVTFSKVDIVVNNTPLDQIVPHLEKVVADPRQNEIIDVLTHEQYFWPFYTNYLPDHPQRMERAIKFLTERGYKPVFLQDEFK